MRVGELSVGQVALRSPLSPYRVGYLYNASAGGSLPYAPPALDSKLSTLDFPPVKLILETERLLLRESTDGDLDFLAAMLADPQVMRFYPKCYSREEAAEWLERARQRYEQEGYAPWLVVLKATGEPIGRVGVSRQVAEGRELDEVGYMIHRPYWRQGYAFEAAAASRDYAFQTLNIPRVVSLIRPSNRPSQYVARKLGMRPEPRPVMFHNIQHMVFAVARGSSKK